MNFHVPLHPAAPRAIHTTRFQDVLTLLGLYFARSAEELSNRRTARHVLLRPRRGGSIWQPGRSSLPRNPLVSAGDVGAEAEHSSEAVWFKGRPAYAGLNGQVVELQPAFGGSQQELPLSPSSVEDWVDAFSSSPEL